MGSTGKRAKLPEGWKYANAAYRYRVYPTPAQEELFAKTVGCCRLYWNTALEDKEWIYHNLGLSVYPMPSEYKNEFPFMKEVDSHALCHVQVDFEQAWKNFFENPKHFGKPKPKKKVTEHKLGASYTTDCLYQKAHSKAKGDYIYQTVEVTEDAIKLPKMDEIKAVIHRPLPEDAKIKTATFTRESNGDYYISLLVEEVVPDMEAFAEDSPELDELRLRDVYAMDYSSPKLAIDQYGNNAVEDGLFGEFFPLERMKSVERHISDVQRQLSRKQKGSKNHCALERKLRDLQRYLANLRKDALRKLAAAIAKHAAIVCIEDLNLKGMAASKGFRNGKATFRNSWGSFVRYLEEALSKRGGRLVKVGRFFASSKTCSYCGHKHSELSLSDRTFVCPVCGEVMDRDWNAAVNIHDEGLRILFGERAVPGELLLSAAARGSISVVLDCAGNSDDTSPVGMPGCALSSGAPAGTSGSCLGVGLCATPLGGNRKGIKEAAVGNRRCVERARKAQ